MEEEAPILRLEILQGPRQGETLDFNPGCAVRIGRVVKGNTLPIKDPGISSRHLSILNESAKWIIRDLDSSNGTALDASQIPPNTPFPLHHDSTIKIGEFTSIHVIFLPPQQQQHALPPRRNPSRRGRTVPAPVPVAPSEQARPRGRPRGRRVVGMDKVQVQSVDENELKSNRERSVVKESIFENLIRAEKVEEACDGKEKGNLNEDDENWLDLNKMTLGEWFDFLEFYLPKQIVDETEEMIVSMTQKAERLREYITVMQQHNVKGDWTYAEAELKRRLGKNYLIYVSSSNTYTKTFTGIDGAGKRLAEEVSDLVNSMTEYSLGTSFSRGGLIAGLEPINFITLATPHLGVRGKKQQEAMVTEQGIGFACIKDVQMNLLQSVERQYLAKLKSRNDVTKTRIENLSQMSSSSVPVLCLEISKIEDFRLEIEQEVILSLFEFFTNVCSGLQYGITPSPVHYDGASLENSSSFVQTSEKFRLSADQCPPRIAPMFNGKPKRVATLPSIVPIGTPWQEIYLLARTQKKISSMIFWSGAKVVG
ncbi:unnamed protein product [Sphenostylis stenocarpa]|uniref:FHA domain-containing protein n=1 Tax=Sphenostylis stenocarpa TaxID=92480 RepID=A0AA86S506_9FABA|nr:unnamed protein product [Sphenostylis stenocarpa]